MEQTTDDGYFFATTAEWQENIYTKHNPDGTTVKRVYLPDCKKTAQVRQPVASDFDRVLRLTSKPTQQTTAMLSHCTMLDGKQATLDEIENLKISDYLLVNCAYTLLNLKVNHG